METNFIAWNKDQFSSIRTCDRRRGSMENISPYGTAVVVAAFMGLDPTERAIRDHCSNPCKNMLLYFIYKVNTCPKK